MNKQTLLGLKLGHKYTCVCAKTGNTEDMQVILAEKDRVRLLCADSYHFIDLTVRSEVSRNNNTITFH